MVFNNNLLLGAGGQSTGPAPFDPTLIGNSVWLDGSADFLSKTPGSTGNQKRFTFAFWIQRHQFTEVAPGIYSAGDGTQNNDFNIYWNNSGGGGQAGDTLCVSQINGGGVGWRIFTSQLFRDIGWYHFIISIDTAESISSDRIKIYLNGDEITSFASASYPSLNADVDYVNDSANQQRIGRNQGSNYINGSLSQYLFLDGNSIQNGDVAVTDFLDAFTYGTNGSQFSPKSNADIAALATAAGGNSFCLDFADSADLGNDISSNSNDFTTNSMSSANQSSSTPSLSYAVLNILDKGSSATTSEGATRQPTATDHVILSSMQIPTTGKWAISGRVDAGDFSFGICTQAHTLTSKIGRTNDSWGAIDAPGASFFRSEHDSVGSNSTSVVSSPNDTFIIAFDADSGKLWLGRNHNGDGIAYLGGGNPATGTTPTYTLSASEMSPGLHFAVGNRLTVSFGQRANFETLPTDFLELNSANLTAPDYQGIDYFNAVKYTGNGTAIGSGGNAVTGVGFQPDWVWIKNRDAADSHALYDIVRGTTKQIETDTTAIETTESEGLTTFGSDGFTVGNLDQVNTNTEDYIAWQWLGSNSTSTNTDGSLTATISVADAGHFSVVSWTGNETLGATIGHGLGGTPEFIIAIARAESGENKPVYHKFMTSDNDHLKINESNAQGTAGTTIWDVSAMSSTLIGLGAAAQSNSSNGMIAYCFRSVPGVCKVGSYEGNGSTNGTYLSLGFKPAFVLFKSVDSTSDWQIFDKSRNGFNVRNNELEANDTAVEDTSTNFLDLLSDGFKMRIASDPNVSETFLYLAMADIGGNGTLPPIYGR